MSQSEQRAKGKRTRPVSAIISHHLRRVSRHIYIYIYTYQISLYVTRTNERIPRITRQECINLFLDFRDRRRRRG